MSYFSQGKLVTIDFSCILYLLRHVNIFFEIFVWCVLIYKELRSFRDENKLFWFYFTQNNTYYILKGYFERLSKELGFDLSEECVLYHKNHAGRSKGEKIYFQTG